MKKLEFEQMAKIEGGVTREVYCNTLNMIILYNCCSDAMWAAWGTNCAPYGFQMR